MSSRSVAVAWHFIKVVAIEPKTLIGNLLAKVSAPIMILARVFGGAAIRIRGYSRDGISRRSPRKSKEESLMIHVITEQSWSTQNGNVEGQPLAPQPHMLDTRLSREAAELCVIALSAKFHHHGYNAEGDYWFGREKDGHEVHRFVVRPATP
jgi:hypothetical protein